MDWRIRLSDLHMSPSQREAAVSVLDSGWWSMGPRTAEFEAAYGAALGCPHNVFVASNTAGLHLALRALDVGPGDEVILPSLTFVADANVVIAVGATPVFADIVSPHQPLIDPASVAALHTSRTKAVVVVHYAGHVADVAAVRAVLGADVPVIEDAAHAVGPVDDTGAWAPIVGDAAVYSFFANKNLPLGEGGVVASHREDLTARVRRLRAHGMTATTWDRHAGHASDYDVVEPGLNYRPLEVSAALGTSGLGGLGEHNATRRSLLGRYRHLLEGSPVSMVFDEDEPGTGHIAVAVLPPATRPAVRAALEERGIQSSFHYPPIHTFTAYRGAPGAGALPQTEAAAERFVTLPLHPYLDAAEVDEVVATVLAAVG